MERAARDLAIAFSVDIAVHALAAFGEHGKATGEGFAGHEGEERGFA